MKKNSIQNPIHVIGTDASGLDHLGKHLQELILSAKSIAGSKRLLDLMVDWWLKQDDKNPLPSLFPTEEPQKLIKWLKAQNQTTIVLASGDPLWFGIGRRLLESIPKNQLEFHPAPSSLQLAFARLGRAWQDTSWISLHGREPDKLIKKLNQKPKSLAILTDPKFCSAKEILKILSALGMENFYEFWICERLGHPKEKIYQIFTNDQIPENLNPLHLVVLLSKVNTNKKQESLPLFGIDDEVFITYSDRPGLMTKREIRIQLLADLDLPKEGVLWDLGAGIGSVGLEALRIRPNLKLMAIEKRGGGKLIIEANAKRLNVKPTKIYESEALKLLNNEKIPRPLSNPDRVILGGGGSQRIQLMEKIVKKINPLGIVVVPLATLEGVNELKEILISSNFTFGIKQHICFKGIPLANGTRLTPLNPVFILKATNTNQIV